MKVKLLTSRAGPSGAQNAGDVIEVSADEAQRMVAAGQAEIVRGLDTQKAIKNAMISEKAVKRAKPEKATK